MRPFEEWAVNYIQYIIHRTGHKVAILSADLGLPPAPALQFHSAFGFPMLVHRRGHMPHYCIEDAPWGRTEVTSVL